MTVDSTYKIEQYKSKVDDKVYFFEMESIGEAAIEVYLIPVVDDRFKLIPDSEYTLEFEYRDPIFARGKITILLDIFEGDIVDIQRFTPRTNENVITDTSFKAEEFEFSMDKICFIQQEIEGHLCDCRGDPEGPPGPGECTGLTITVPVNDIVSPTIGTVETFSVSYAGTGPVSHQWYKIFIETGEEDLIPGQTFSSYSFIVSEHDKNGDKYKVVLSNACSQIEDEGEILLDAYTCNAFEQAALGAQGSAFYNLDEPYVVGADPTDAGYFSPLIGVNNLLIEANRHVGFKGGTMDDGCPGVQAWQANAPSFGGSWFRLDNPETFDMTSRLDVVFIPINTGEIIQWEGTIAGIGTVLFSLSWDSGSGGRFKVNYYPVGIGGQSTEYFGAASAPIGVNGLYGFVIHPDGSGIDYWADGVFVEGLTFANEAGIIEGLTIITFMNSAHITQYLIFDADKDILKDGWDRNKADYVP